MATPPPVPPATALALPLVLLCLFVPFASAHLVTDGPRLRNSTTGAIVRLRCVNWYGAHQEPCVPGGLEQASADAIAALIVRTGANCVRLPLSDATVLNDPPVEPRFLLRQPGAANSSSAMQVLDDVVRALTARGLLVILNSHTSRPGWVGGGQPEEAPQGLWHDARHSTTDWVRALASLAGRYAANDRVVGLDLRNEIHDQDGVTLTWGRSNDPDTDWRAAATLADRAIAAVNPHALIIVSGLCRAYDLRSMLDDRPGPDAALLRRKLVYTAHVYTFSWWWTHLDLRSACGVAGPVLLLSAALLLLALLLPFEYDDDDGYYYYRNDDEDDKNKKYATTRASRHHYYYLIGDDTASADDDRVLLLPLSPQSAETLAAAAAAFLPFACLWIAVAYAKAAQAHAVGCSTIAAESTPWLVAGAALLVLAAAVACSGITLPPRTLGIWLLAWTTLAAAAVCTLYAVSTTDWMVHAELARWRLPSHGRIPIWLGEFGTSVGNASPTWRRLTRLLLREYDLDFAYWAINGRKWMHGAWEPEAFGLLTEDYAAVRNQTFADSIFSPNAQR